jgi:hypothetical protein
MTTAQKPVDTITVHLPVFATVFDGYRAAVRRLRSFLALVVVWAALAAGTGYGIEQLTHSWAKLRAHYTLQAVVRDEATQIAQYAELLLAASMIGIAVYRAVILAEPPQRGALARIGRREMRYVALAILFSVPAHFARRSVMVALNLGVAPTILSQAAAAIGIPILRTVCLFVMVHLLVSIALTPFLGLAFPLIAIDTPGSALRLSPRLSREYRIRLAAIGFLAPLPTLPLIVAPYLGGFADTTTLLALQATVGIFLNLLSTALVAGVFAVAFQRLTAQSNIGTYGVFD